MTENIKKESIICDVMCRLNFGRYIIRKIHFKGNDQTDEYYAVYKDKKQAKRVCKYLNKGGKNSVYYIKTLPGDFYTRIVNDLLYNKFYDQSGINN